MNSEFWILLGLYGLTAIGIYAGRNWLRAWIERGVQHRFDVQLEELRAAFRQSEENFKSELRTKEAEFSALRDAVLSGRAQRQVIIDKRRLDAVERLWASVVSLAPYRNLAASMTGFNFETVARRAPQDPRLRSFFAVMTAAATPNATIPDNPAKNERPFISPIAWAYFLAFQTIVQGAFAYAKVFELGVDNPGSFFNIQNIQEVLKAALPHEADFIEKNHPLQYHRLLDELEQKLLIEIDRTLRGEEQDEASAAQAAKIIAMTTKAATEAQEAYQRAAAQTQSRPSSDALATAQ